MSPPPRLSICPQHRLGVLLLCFILLSHALEQKTSQHFIHAQRKKDKFVRETKGREDKSRGSCGGTGSVDRRQVLSRHPRDLRQAGGRVKFGTAVYFSGRQVLKLAPYRHRSFASSIPMGQFTLEAWIRPEGGQPDPVTVLALHDTCDGMESAGKWTIGLQTSHNDGEADARMFFSLKSQRSLSEMALVAHEQYQPGKWVHVSVTYDGHKVTLYINSAMVGMSTLQQGNIFSLSSSMCKEIHLGGDVTTGNYFRGSVDDFRLWSIPLSHYNISKYGSSTDLEFTRAEGLIFQENFSDIRRWTSAAGGAPDLVTSSIPHQHHDISISPTLCGKTVCDNPDVIRSYTQNWQLTQEKVIRYKIINLMEDDGLNPVVTSEQIFIQHEALNAAFEPYNITFDLYVENIRNTSLRKRFIMIGCDPANVGDRVCQPQCQHTRTGNDGGDCDEGKEYCDPQKKGNGKCDFECNKEYHDWDLGDCCQAGEDSHSICYNNTSPHRGYLGIDEYRDALQISANAYLNVFFASTTTDKLIGLATFPWEHHLHSFQGGTVVQPETFGRPGQTDSLVHEIGHNLGLWHVHHGVSEMECSDPCLETRPSLELGDLCEDTAPTPQNLHCGDPAPHTEDTCGLPNTYTDTPYRNYMSYADDNCTDHFSPNQVARMHCYLDLMYKSWTTNMAPSPVPLAPRVLSADATSATFAWIPPFSMGTGSMDGTCSQCIEHGSLYQFADYATSPAPRDIWDWAPMQATGPPDAMPCDSDISAWLPKLKSCTENMCYVDLTLRWPVKPASLSVWVTWNAHRGLRKIRLYYEDGTFSTLTEVDAFCDIPFTAKLEGDRKLVKIRIYTRSPYVAIDAIEVLSQPMNEHCLSCPPIKYKVTRYPPMRSQEATITSELRFSDLELAKGQTYMYWVSVVAGHQLSADSPPLIYTHGQPFCGDGLVDSQSLEECDDGNTVSGDGCDVECQIEETFHCKGSPSLCYRHSGDGVCEEFERRSSVEDCGFFTPSGFTDQWAHSALANPDYQLPLCPETVVIGPPDTRHQGCGRFVDMSRSWYPCGSKFIDANFWLEVYFLEQVVATEILIYITSDGRTDHDTKPKNISVDLITVTNQTVVVSKREITLDCSHSVTSVPVSHDLSKPFFHTIGVRISFHSYNISIAAVKLRSSPLLDPVRLASCGPLEVYNPRSGVCVRQNCSTVCPSLAVQRAVTRCSGSTEGHSCQVNCRDGYRLTGNKDRVICAGGRWHDSESLKCVPVDCHTPRIPFASHSCPKGTSYNNRCTFKCVPPAKQQGSGNLIRCEADGLWSVPRASCRVRCDPPLHIPHAKLITRGCKKGRKSLNTACKFRCKKGFHVESQRPTRRVFQLKCGLDAMWSGARCVRVKCPQLPTVYAGLYKCTDNSNSRSRCVLKCPDGSISKQKIVCKSTGKWSGEFMPCKSFTAAVCRPPSHPRLLNTGNKAKLYKYGSILQVKCRQPIHELVYTSRRSRELNIKPPLASNHVVSNITCTGSGRWFPSPQHLTCLEKCSLDAVSDGWCDAVNNRHHCKWDGGDCCTSTAGKKVVPFPDSCTKQCTCKDPNAKENKKKKGKRRKKKKKYEINLSED